MIELVLYLLGAALMIMMSAKLEPQAKTHLHILSGVFWPFLVALIVVMRLAGYEYNRS